MFKPFKFILILTILLYLPFQSQAQSISLRPTPLMTNAQVLYFSNFDFFNVGGAQHLFDVTVSGLDPGNPTNPNTIIEICLELNGEVVSRAKSDPFPTTSSTNTYTASNIDLIYLQRMFPDQEFSITFNIDLNSPDEKFEDELYGSGKARRGKYRFFTKLYINNALVDEFSTGFFTITNPSDIQLSSPGNKVGSAAPQEVMTDLPVFVFFSDGTEFVLKIFEKLAHHQSVEDVLNSGNPICEEPLTTPILDYAMATTGQPLQIGHTYYWYVDVLVPTTAGQEKFRSEVFQFKVVESSGTNQNDAAVASIIEMLRPIVGNEVDNISKNLTDFELKNIRLNGRPITVYELLQIIDGYEGHLIEVSDLILY